MQRSYDVRAVALATQTPVKWVDNLLSHHHLPGIEHGRQGVQRCVSDDGLLAIELTRQFNYELGIPLQRAARLAASVLRARADKMASLAIAEEIQLSVNIAAVARRLREQVVSAMETVSPRRRGRPPRSAQTKTAPGSIA